MSRELEIAQSFLDCGLAGTEEEPRCGDCRVCLQTEIAKLRAEVDALTIQRDTRESVILKMSQESTPATRILARQLKEAQAEVAQLRAQLADTKSALQTSRLATKERDDRCTELRAELARTLFERDMALGKLAKAESWRKT